MKIHILLIVIGISVYAIGCKNGASIPSPVDSVSKPGQTRQDTSTTTSSRASAIDSPLIAIQGANLSYPDSCILISRKLEPDSTANHLLRWYICNNLYSNDPDANQQDIAKVVSRNSFLLTIRLFYADDTKFEHISYYDEKYRLADNRSNLLYGARNCCMAQLYPIADDLLKAGRFDGVEVLWQGVDGRRLPSLENYIHQADSDNFHVMADLVVFFHNNGLFERRDLYLKKAKRINGYEKEYAALKKLTGSRARFDYVTYAEEVFGGM